MTPPPASDAPAGAGERRVLLVAIGVGLAAAALYLPTVRAGLVWDDREYVLADGGRHLAAALTGDLIAGANPGHGPCGYWRPLAVASYLAVQALGGAPWLHHLLSALLHGLAAALLVLLLTRRVGALLPAAAAALLWAFHPAQSETVAWVSARYDLLTGVLAAALLLLPFRPGPGRPGSGPLGWGRPGMGHAAAVFGLFLAGLLSKESFAAVALVVAADDLGARRGLREVLPRWLAVAAAVAVWLGLRTALEIPRVATPALSGAPAHALAALAREAWRALWPLPLTVSHPVGPPSASALLAGAAVAAALLALAWRVRALAPPVALFLGPLALAAVAIASLGEAPDRYFYLPSIGLAWLLAAGLAGLARRAPGLARIALVLTAAAAAGGAAAVSLRLPDWRNEEALFAAAVRVDPDDAIGNTALGLAAARAGRLDEGRERLERAVRRRPGAPRPITALAWLHLRRGDAPAALEAARRAIALAPSSPQARLYLANALHLSGDHAGELLEAGRAVALSPGLREARITGALARCEVEGAACEPELDALAGEGILAGADLLAARAEAALRYRDGVVAAARVARLRAAFPADPRLRVLEPAAARLAGAPRE